MKNIAHVGYFFRICFTKKYFRLGYFCRVAFCYRFLEAPRHPQTLKIKQNQCSVARNQGFAKNKKKRPRGAILTRFWSLFGALFCDVFSFFWVIVWWFGFFVILGRLGRDRAEGVSGP